ncbi:hypothetical protein ABTH46_19830, partial [Acinetobacter baumannii]
KSFKIFLGDLIQHYFSFEMKFVLLNKESLQEFKNLAGLKFRSYLFVIKNRGLLALVLAILCAVIFLRVEMHHTQMMQQLLLFVLNLLRL